VGPALAGRLGVPFLDRAIPFAVAERLDVDVAAAERHDFRVATSRLERVLRGFIGQDVGAPVPVAPELNVDDDFRRATEEVLLTQAATGQGVILGRAGAIVLRDRPEVFKARLDGPPARRAAQAARAGRMELAEAERTVERLDRTHDEYVRRFYGADIHDPGHYDLVLDSTAIDLDTCVELLVTAARSRSEAKPQG
jgi:cytidylate kinase